jgi:hypothetical protein
VLGRPDLAAHAFRQVCHSLLPTPSYFSSTLVVFVIVSLHSFRTPRRRRRRHPHGPTMINEASPAECLLCMSIVLGVFHLLICVTPPPPPPRPRATFNFNFNSTSTSGSLHETIQR